MDEKSMNMRVELELLETRVRSVIEEATKQEKTAIKNQAQRLANKIESILNYYGAAPAGQIAPTVSKINWDTISLMQSELEAIREREFNETRANMVGINGKDDKDNLESIAQFEKNGVVRYDTSFYDIVERICNSVAESYKGRFNYVGDRGADAYKEINGATKNSIQSFQRLHAEYSQKIKSQVESEISALGVKLSEAQKEHIEQTVQNTATSLMDNLQALTFSDKEITVGDAKTFIGDDELITIGHIPSEPISQDLEDSVL